MKSFYENCISYFQEFSNDKKDYLEDKSIDSKDESTNVKNNMLIQTITPFTFITEHCLNMIKDIETKENISFKEFIQNKRKYTEFYLYYSYLYFNNLNKSYFYNINMIPVLTIGNNGSEKHNTIKHKLRKLQKINIKVISLHRKAILTLDKNYKMSLLDIYSRYFEDINTLLLIKNMLNIN